MGRKNCLLQPAGNSFFHIFLIFRYKVVEILMLDFTGAIKDYSPICLKTAGSAAPGHLLA